MRGVDRDGVFAHPFDAQHTIGDDGLQPVDVLLQLLARALLEVEKLLVGDANRPVVAVDVVLGVLCRHRELFADHQGVRLEYRALATALLSQQARHDAGLLARELVKVRLPI